MSEDEFTNNQCNDCGKVFDSSFELIDHVLDDDEEFDPYYALPSGYKLLLGSLLRFLYGNADNPEQIKHITQSTYVALFAAENADRRQRAIGQWWETKKRFGMNDFRHKILFSRFIY